MFQYLSFAHTCIGYVPYISLHEPWSGTHESYLDSWNPPTWRAGSSSVEVITLLGFRSPWLPSFLLGLCVFLLLLALVFLYVWRYILCTLYYYLIFACLYCTLWPRIIYFISIFCGQVGPLSTSHIYRVHFTFSLSFLWFFQFFCSLIAYYCLLLSYFRACMGARRCLVDFCCFLLVSCVFLLLCVFKKRAWIFSFLCIYIFIIMSPI